MSRIPFKDHIEKHTYLLTFMLACLLMLGITSCVSAPAVRGTAPSQESLQPPTKSPALFKPMPIDWQSRWLRGVPCRLPCWEGITLGKTTASQAVELLQNSPLISTAYISVTAGMPELGYISWKWADGTAGGGASFNAIETTPFVGGIKPYYPVGFRLGDVIDEYGEPSHILATAYYNPDRIGISYHLKIVYRSLGLILETGGASKPVLSTNTDFDAVFFAPTSEGLKYIEAPNHPEWLVPWEGMKDFEFYCQDSENGKACRGDSRIQ